jgi:hypothetical protein
MASKNGDRATAGGRALRAVFIDAGLHYVDERGEHSGLVSEHVNPEEDRCRLAVVSNTESRRPCCCLGAEEFVVACWSSSNGSLMERR